jgi:hypothetical protein
MWGGVGFLRRFERIVRSLPVGDGAFVRSLSSFRQGRSKRTVHGNVLHAFGMHDRLPEVQHARRYLIMTDASKLTDRFFSEQGAIRRHLDLIERRLLPSVEEAVAFASTLHRCNVVPEREARQIADQVRTIDRMRLTEYLSELGGRFLPTIVEKIAEAEPEVEAYRRRLGEDEEYNVEAFEVVRDEVNADTTEDERRELVATVVDSELDMPVDDEDSRWTRDELLAVFEPVSVWAVLDAKTSRRRLRQARLSTHCGRRSFCWSRSSMQQSSTSSEWRYAGIFLCLSHVWGRKTRYLWTHFRITKTLST